MSAMKQSEKVVNNEEKSYEDEAENSQTGKY